MGVTGFSSPDPSVAAVLTTTGTRPQLLLRALQSVAAQDHAVAEIIIVCDSADPRVAVETRALAEQALGDRPCQVLTTGGGKRANYARNLGGRAASSQYIAFLDDDDEWRPRKTGRQVALARKLEVTGKLPVVACRSEVLLPRGRATWPKILPQAETNLARYLLRPDVLRPGRRVLHTSMLFMAREVLEAITFDETLPRMQEWDFLIRFSAMPRAAVVADPEVLAVWHCEATAGRTSTRNDWRSSQHWVDGLRPTIGDSLANSVVATLILDIAIRQRGRKEALRVLRAVGPRNVPLATWPQVAVLLARPRGGSRLHATFGSVYQRAAVARRRRDNGTSAQAGAGTVSKQR